MEIDSKNYIKLYSKNEKTKSFCEQLCKICDDLIFFLNISAWSSLEAEPMYSFITK